MKITYHDFDRSHLQTLVPEKAETFQVVLEQAHRNPNRLSMLMSLAIDYAGCLAATNPDAKNLPLVLKIGAQAAAAIFTLTQTPSGEDITLPLGAGPPARYLFDKSLISPEPRLWLTGFYLAAITRDKLSKDLLCAVSTHFIHSGHVHSPKYLLPFVQTLRALHLGTTHARQHLTDAQTLLAQEPFSIHEGNVGIDLNGPIFALCERIVENDFNGFQATLEKALLLHKAYWGQDSDRRDMPAGFLALGPLAMSCLARDRGTQIKVVSDYLPPRLIENPKLDQQRAILQILHQSPHPLSWHGIATRLGNQGIYFPGNLVAFLRELAQQGFLIHSQAEGYPHGVYSLTNLGRDQLNR